MPAVPQFGWQARVAELEQQNRFPQQSNVSQLWFALAQLAPPLPGEPNPPPMPPPPNRPPVPAPAAPPVPLVDDVPPGRPIAPASTGELPLEQAATTAANPSTAHHEARPRMLPRS